MVVEKNILQTNEREGAQTENTLLSLNYLVAIYIVLLFFIIIFFNSGGLHWSVALVVSGVVPGSLVLLFFALGLLDGELKDALSHGGLDLLPGVAELDVERLVPLHGLAECAVELGLLRVEGVGSGSLADAGRLLGVVNLVGIVLAGGLDGILGGLVVLVVLLGLGDALFLVILLGFVELPDGLVVLLGGLLGGIGAKGGGEPALVHFDEVFHLLRAFADVLEVAAHGLGRGL
jgi:hypothetical protein